MEYNRFEDIPQGAFSIIAADPPWRFATYSQKGKEKKSAELHYGTMTLEDIRALPVASLAAPDCALFLWTTAPMLAEGMRVMTEWGFQYKSFGVWGKTTRHGKIAFGTGYRLRSACEPFLVGTRGNPKNTRGERSLIMAGVREHSQKPDEFYALVERWMPEARRLDLFSRTRRSGWSAFGDEIGKFDEVAA
jgi:N6-adenosine-specific RNA methylase IME4